MAPGWLAGPGGLARRALEYLGSGGNAPEARMHIAKQLLLSGVLGLVLSLAAPLPARAAEPNSTSDFTDFFPVPETIGPAQTALAVATLPGLDAQTSLLLANLPGASTLYPTDSSHLSLASQTVYNLVSPLLANNPAAAVEVAVVSPYGTATYGFGSAKGAGTAAPDGDSIFQVASITKTFTGTLVAQAVLDGKIDMNAPAELYMPSWISLPTYNGTQITMTNLVTHTSGLPTDVTDATGAATLEPSFAQLASTVNNAQLATKPGTLWNYGNIDTTLAGLAVENVYGTSYEDLLHKEILDPLGMASTTSLPVTDSARLVQGYHSPGQPATPAFTNPAGSLESPAGSIASTANDLIKYMQANLGLTTTGIDNAMTLAHLSLFDVTTQNSIPAISLGLNTQNTLLWSMGSTWLLPPGPYSTLVTHAGSLDGAMSNLVMDPFTKTGVVLLYNQTQSGNAVDTNTIAAAALNTQADVVSISQDILDTQVQLEEATALAMRH